MITQDVAIFVFLLVLNVYVFFQDSKTITSEWILLIELTVIVAVTIAVATEVLNLIWTIFIKIVLNLSSKNKKKKNSDDEQKEFEEQQSFNNVADEYDQARLHGQVKRYVSMQFGSWKVRQNKEEPVLKHKMSGVNILDGDCDSLAHQQDLVK